MCMHAIQGILDSKISGGFKTSCTELLEREVCKRDSPNLDRNYCFEGLNSAKLERPCVHEQSIVTEEIVTLIQYKEH